MMRALELAACQFLLRQVVEEANTVFIGLLEFFVGVDGWVVAGTGSGASRYDLLEHALREVERCPTGWQQ